MGAVGGDKENGDISDYEVCHHIRHALKAVSKGNSVRYDELIEILRHNSRHPDPNQVAMLVTILHFLSRVTSYIDVVHHRSLLSSICKMSFWNYGPNVMDELVKFLVALAAASNGSYLDLCLDMLVTNFIPPQKFLELLKQPRGVAKKNQVIGRLHLAFKGIADLLPVAAPSRLEQIVRERVPHVVYSNEAQIAVYVENMLKFESGDMGELLGNSMIFELVNRLIDLDVEILWDDEVDDPNGNTGCIFDMARPTVEMMDMDDEGNVAAQKLDTLMDLTFDHLQSCFKNGRLHQVFEALLHSFQSTVLTAYKPKFAQFVIFYACSLDPEVCGTQFVSKLLEIFTGTIYHQDWRLVGWCYKYCKKQRGEITSKNHGVFYAGCQGVMYVLCFRLRSILATPHLKSQLLNMRLKRIFNHALNPLKVCLPSIVEEFVHQAEDVFAFDHLSDAFGGFQRPLDAFFPFDPYLLKKSDRCIRPNFIFWSMVRPTYEEEEEDDDVGSVSDDEI